MEKQVRTLSIPDLSLDPLYVLDIKQGGYGSVYKVQASDGRRLALKSPKGLKAADVVNLKREALKSVSIQRHPNILTPLGVTSYEDNIYIIMECMESSLRDVMMTDVSIEKKLDILSQVLDGLVHLHDVCDTLHLDLKPENILMSSSGTPLISDFGLSEVLLNPHSLKEGITQDIPSGTLAYMSPEHFQRKKLTDKTDVFAFGIIAYEFLTGRHPFMPAMQGDNFFDELTARITGSYIDFRIGDRLRLPKPIKEACRKSLQKSSSQMPSAR